MLRSYLFAQALLLIAALATAVSWQPVRADQRLLVLQGAPAVAARLLDPHRDLIAKQAAIGLIVIPTDPAKGLTALLEGRADVAMLSGDCDAAFAALSDHRPDLSLMDLQIFEVDRLGGRASSLVTRGPPTAPIRRLIDAARHVAATHPF